jgi:hypothetical protein
MRAIVLVATGWPLVHAGLVARFHVDPWELFGWSMYTQPAARVQVRVDVERDGQVQPLRVMGERRRAIRRYAQRVTALGRLASGASLARQVFGWDPGVDAVTLVLREIVLDPETARLVAHESTERYERGVNGP